MTVTIELSEEQAAALQARAADEGVSLEVWVQRLAEQYAQQATPRSESGTDLPIWEKIVALTKDLPDEVVDKLPRDGASEHDHYLYGVPKRNR